MDDSILGDILSPDSFNGFVLVVCTLGLTLIFGVIALVSWIGASLGWGERGRVVAKAALMPAGSNLVLGLPILILFVFDRDVLRGNTDFDWANLIALPWLLLNALWFWRKAQPDD
jgi:hypothetical protein